MSYANYWYRPIELNEETYEAIVKDTQRLGEFFRRKGIRIEYIDTVGENERRMEAIIVEGQAETFIFPKVLPEEFKKIFLSMKDGRMFQFVSTNRHRYDLAVQMILIITKHHLKEQIIITSNGDDWDWENAKELVQSHLGYGSDFELEESPEFEEMDAKISWTVYEDGKEVKGSNYDVKSEEE